MPGVHRSNHDTQVNDALFVAENAVIVGDVVLEKGVNVWYGAVIRGDLNSIRIGWGSNVQENAALHVERGCGVVIGSNVSIGHGAIVHGCTVGDNVIVGMGALLLSGAVIQENSIVGAGCVVREETTIPPRSLVVGVPGRVVRRLSDKEVDSIVKNAAEYRKLAEEHRRLKRIDGSDG